MSRKNAVDSLSEFKARASQFLEGIPANGEEIILTQNSSATAVVQDYQTCRNFKNGPAYMKLMVHGESDVEAGRLMPQSQAFADVKERLWMGAGLWSVR